MTAQDNRTAAEARQDGNYLERLVESCFGAQLPNTSFGTNIELTYWRKQNQEVDFVLRQGKTTVAIEVKSGRRAESLQKMEAFAKHFKSKRKLLSVDRELNWLNFSRSQLVIGCNNLCTRSAKCQKTLTAATNARFAALHGLPVVPYPSRRRPFHSARPRARHERHF